MTIQGSLFLRGSHPIIILSRLCVPFVIGYSLTQTQMETMRARLCTPEECLKFPKHPQVALNDYLTEKGKQEPIILHKSPDGETLYLWTKGILPSFSGERPKFQVPPLDLAKYPEFEGLGDVKPDCIEWPVYFDIPDWFYPRLTKYAKHWQARLREKQKRLANAQPASNPALLVPPCPPKPPARPTMDTVP
ncbi:hypothetical protein R3P38DRAFT_2923499 [Favolaschia claudopus]|uniref:Uncharacterized protein n=1 Tax=Favolaschia claudopus TaxID=2862362 RepID=A0AAW0BVC9_9AGAR